LHRREQQRHNVRRMRSRLHGRDALPGRPLPLSWRQRWPAPRERPVRSSHRVFLTLPDGLRVLQRWRRGALPERHVHAGHAAWSEVLPVVTPAVAFLGSRSSAEMRAGGSVRHLGMGHRVRRLGFAPSEAGVPS
jgi:hypothetical protein